MRKSREKQAEILVNEKWCKKCGICIEFCPQKVLTSGVLGEPQVTHPDQCTQCRLCEIYCPEFSITVSTF